MASHCLGGTVLIAGDFKGKERSMWLSFSPKKYVVDIKLLQLCTLLLPLMCNLHATIKLYFVAFFGKNLELGK